MRINKIASSGVVVQSFGNMDNYSITISVDKEVHHFEVGEYLHEDGERCKFKVFKDGKLMASFAPDRFQILHLCQNPANLKEELLHLLADQIEAHHPHGIQADPELED